MTFSCGRGTPVGDRPAVDHLPDAPSTLTFKSLLETLNPEPSIHVQAIYLLSTNCPTFPRRVTQLYLVYILSLFSLFFHFFVQAYSGQKKSKSKKA